MRNPLTWLSRQRHPYDPLITVEISRKNLLNNLAEFRKLAPNGKVAPVLKSNAYGHGLFTIAKIIDKQNRAEYNNIPFFVVDSYFEAVALRAQGIKSKLLIIGYTPPDTITGSQLPNVSFTISHIETLRKIINSDEPTNIHLKIDTGMRRQGIPLEGVDEVITLLFDNSRIRLEGLCSHFSDADNIEPGFTETQIHLWNKVVHKIKSQISNVKYLHISNTFGHKFTKDIDANVTRLGIGLYGLADGQTFNPNLHLLPILQMKTVITSIKKLKREETVGYNNTFEAEKDMTIATIPVGYFEGIDRRLSNIGSVQVGESKTFCPIIGRVSMNITTIDVSNALNVKVGTLVTVISNDSTASNSIIKMAKLCNTIPHEIVVHIPQHLKRVVVE